MGSFEDLTPFPDGTIGLSFSVESLSLANDRPKAVAEVNRVLQSGGRFIVVDGYLGQSAVALTKEELVIRHLVGRGRELKEYETYSDFIDTAARGGFIIEGEVDVSTKVKGMLNKYEKKAKRFFETPVIAKPLSKIKSSDFAFEMISHYLMPLAVENGMAQYKITVMRKS